MSSFVIAYAVTFRPATHSATLHVANLPTRPCKLHKNTVKYLPWQTGEQIVNWLKRKGTHFVVTAPLPDSVVIHGFVYPGRKKKNA